MKKTATSLAVGALLAGSLLGGCASYAPDTTTSADDDFFAEDFGGTQPAPSKKVAKAKPAAAVAEPVAVAAAVPEVKESAPPIVKTPAMAESKPQPPRMECTPHDRQSYFNKAGIKVEEVKVRATGYGAPPKAFYPEPQRRLMAMRAAKIDAYRSLAERVKGVQIWGGTTIGDMVVEKDRFRVFLDTFLVGAKVMLQTPQDDGTFETVVEMKVGQKFLHTMLDNQIMESPKDANDPCGGMQPGSRMMQTHRPMDGEFIPTRASLARSGFYFDRE